jgi:hypothetical protein
MDNPISKERLDVPQISFVFPIIIARCWVVWMERWVKPSFLTSPIIHPSVLYRFIILGLALNVGLRDWIYEFV